MGTEAYDIKMAWIDGHGTRFPLSDAPDVEVFFDVASLMMPPFTYETVENNTPGSDCTPKQDLRTVQRLVVEEREIPLKLRFRANNPADLHRTVRKYVQAFSPLKGEGILEVTAPDGVVRKIPAIYDSGFEAAINTKNTSPIGLFQDFPVTLVAHDPYFQADSTTSITLERGEPVPFFPILPLVLARFDTFGEVTVDNDGDVEAWPTWILTGPFDAVRLDNLTTDTAIQIDHPISAGDRLIINTTPGQWSITRESDGENLYPYLTPESRIFPLALGLNRIRVEATNFGEETAIQLTFTKRYLSI